MDSLPIAKSTIGKDLKGSSVNTCPTLLILAAGMGSRYGGLKQLDPMGPGGETILEYSVFDAIRAGFGKVVFVIRKEFDQAFREQVLGRFDGAIDIDCVYQDLSDLPPPHTVPLQRKKPWGTGHAVLAARKAIHSPFAVINADDFYGAQTFRVLADFCRDWDRGSDDGPVKAGLAAYPLSSTLSAHGEVSRGVCSTDAAGRLLSITEQGNIRSTPEGPEVARGPNSGRIFGRDQLVSMNAFAFESGFFAKLMQAFEGFLSEHGDADGSEFFLPEACTRLMLERQLDIRVVRSDASWLGVTYSADADGVRSALKMFTDQGLYPEGLWQQKPDAADE